MKVLKKGKVEWKSKVTCTGCNSLLEIEEADVRYRVSDEAAHAQQDKIDIKGDYLVTCPECGEHIKLKFVPSAIQEKIKTKL